MANIPSFTCLYVYPCTCHFVLIPVLFSWSLIFWPLSFKFLMFKVMSCYLGNMQCDTCALLTTEYVHAHFGKISRCTLYTCKPINNKNSEVELELTMKGVFHVQVFCLSLFEIWNRMMLMPNANINCMCCHVAKLHWPGMKLRNSEVQLWCYFVIMLFVSSC